MKNLLKITGKLQNIGDWISEFQNFDDDEWPIFGRYQNSGLMEHRGLCMASSQASWFGSSDHVLLCQICRKFWVNQSKISGNFSKNFHKNPELARKMIIRNYYESWKLQKELYMRWSLDRAKSKKHTSCI